MNMIPSSGSLNYNATTSRLGPKERILRDIVKMDGSGCWEWQKGVLKSGGYGQLNYRRKNWRAHCLSYVAFVGEIPKGQCVLHKCDNPLCCNPEHLSVGTYAENTQDMMAKGRHRVNRGYGSRAKLTRDQVEEIRETYTPRKRGQTMSALAKRFNISEAQVLNIIKGKCWKGAA